MTTGIATTTTATKEDVLVRLIGARAHHRDESARIFPRRITHTDTNVVMIVTVIGPEMMAHTRATLPSLRITRNKHNNINRGSGGFQKATTLLIQLIGNITVRHQLVVMRLCQHHNQILCYNQHAKIVSIAIDLVWILSTCLSFLTLIRIIAVKESPA